MIRGSECWVRNSDPCGDAHDGANKTEPFHSIFSLGGGSFSSPQPHVLANDAGSRSMDSLAESCVFLREWREHSSGQDPL